MVIGLPQSLADQSAVNAIADLAEFLNIELLAAVIADSSLNSIAGWSAVRELRIPGHGWQPIDWPQMTREIDHVISLARQRFADAVKSCTVRTSFDVVAGTQIMASLIRPDDIVAIIEPSHPGERITRQFSALLDAALEAARAVLILPRKIARTSGPIMALATAADDASIPVALEVAAALKEDLIVVGAAPTATSLADAEQRGIRVQTAAAGAPPSLTEVISASHPRERLHVATRTGLPADAGELFSALHGVPLLVVTSAFS
jgi:hypothetical protein